MKTIHPELRLTAVRCTSCGNTFTTRSTRSELVVDTCQNCHPAYTGVERAVASGQPHRALRAAPAACRKKVRSNLTTIIEEPIQAFLADAEERGSLEESALETFAAEHDLDEEELVALRAELEAREIDVLAPVRAEARQDPSRRTH